MSWGPNNAQANQIEPKMLVNKCQDAKGVQKLDIWSCIMPKKGVEALPIELLFYYTFHMSAAHPIVIASSLRIFDMNPK